MKIRRYEVPDVLGNIEELRVIYEVTLRQVEQLRARLDSAQNELDVQTASEAGLTRFERMFNLDATGYTIDERRFRLECWMADIGVYSATNIEKWVENFGGEGTTAEVIVSNVDGKTYPKATVRIPLNSEKKVEDIRRKLEKILPMGAIIDVSALYSTFSKYKEQSWNDLSDKTFGEIKRGA